MSKIAIADLKKVAQDSYDYFLCCSSFEDRCLSVANALKGIFISKSFIYYSADQKGKIFENLKHFQSVLQNPQLVPIHSDDPVQTIFAIHDSIITEIKNAKETVKLLVDISTFTHETLLMLFRLLFLRSDEIQISICYTNVLEYSYNVISNADKWLTKGVGDVRNILGYPGYINPARKNHLIILFGFEVERTIRIIEKFEADIVSIGFATETSSVSSEHYLINVERHKQLKANYSNLNLFDTSLVDPYATKLDILNQIDKFPDTNVIIAPMNTKISTIGVALAFLENADIQLCYVKANLYNTEGYSRPNETMYFFDLKLN